VCPAYDALKHIAKHGDAACNTLYILKVLVVVVTCMVHKMLYNTVHSTTAGPLTAHVAYLNIFSPS
jgi:hypothetical protein